MIWTSAGCRCELHLLLSCGRECDAQSGPLSRVRIAICFSACCPGGREMMLRFGDSQQCQTKPSGMLGAYCLTERRPWVELMLMINICQSFVTASMLPPLLESRHHAVSRLPKQRRSMEGSDPRARFKLFSLSFAGWVILGTVLCISVYLSIKIEILTSQDSCED